MIHVRKTLTQFSNIKLEAYVSYLDKHTRLSHNVVKTVKMFYNVQPICRPRLLLQSNRGQGKTKSFFQSPRVNPTKLFFSNVQAGGFFALFESIGATLRSFSLSALPARGLNKDPTLLLNGARPPPKYVFKNNMSLANSKI